MGMDRRQRIRALLAADHDDTSTLERICALAVSELAVTGAGVVLIDHAGTIDAQQRLVRASDDVAARLEDLQLTVGEGPGLTAAATAGPVLVPDLAVEASRWPAFAPGAQAAGAAAVFAIPLTLGAISLGSLDCYRGTAGRLHPYQVTDALFLAELALEAVLAEVAGHDADDLDWISDIHAEVHRASGMVMEQLGIPIHAALLRIRGYAYVNDLPVAVVAAQILRHDLILERE
ncbi:MAG TPA: ANTAR domain-containing protein [Pseudonocardiaceae bacterium]|jgi:hypothetical protein|nr:ANTAR domain-containing protein [Pseudonocardiaceae bacterium]